MKNYYIYSLYISLILFFILQLISYINYLMVDQNVITGFLDPFILLKTNLIIIPITFLLIFFIGFFNHLYKLYKF